MVRDDPRRLEVALVEGRARFDTMTHARCTSTPGDVAIATPRSVSLTKESEQDLANELGWRRGVLVFRHTTLADAAAEFNRYNNEKIVLADASVAQRTIGGSFTVTDVERFAIIVRDALGLKVIQNRDGDIVIWR